MPTDNCLLLAAFIHQGGETFRRKIIGVYFDEICAHGLQFVHGRPSSGRVGHCKRPGQFWLGSLNLGAGGEDARAKPLAFAVYLNTVST
jgi:hypothetical protein